MSFQEYKDSFGTYYQFNNIKDETVTIFIHGVGLDNTMWYPQKKFFSKKPVLFYDLLNHGQSTGGYEQLNFEIFNNQLLNLINEYSIIIILILTNKTHAKFQFTKIYFLTINRI